MQKINQKKRNSRGNERKKVEQVTSQLVDRAKYPFVIIKCTLQARQKGKPTELI